VVKKIYSNPKLSMEWNECFTETETFEVDYLLLFNGEKYLSKTI